MLDIEHISVEYDGKEVIRDFSLHMEQGQVVSLVGESGSGKTTVIRAVLGLLPAGGEVTAGSIRFEGESLLSCGEAHMDSLRGTQISMIFQDSGSVLDPIRRIGSQFVEYIRLHENISRGDAWKKAVSMLEMTRLPDCENVMRSYPFQLSGGMRQRVGIAFAMTFRPKLLLADEPTSALDVTTQAQIVREMINMHRTYGTSIILVTHNLGVAAYMSDHIVVMQNGRIAEQGTREEVIHAPKEAYTKSLLEAIPDIDGVPYV